MSNLLVAQTILAQLGGTRFLQMTGADRLVGNDKMLMFCLPKNPSKINKVRITLTPMDLYHVEFFCITNHGLDVHLVAESTMVYADKLGEVFTAATGLEVML